jgi:hypothetical protein
MNAWDALVVGAKNEEFVREHDTEELKNSAREPNAQVTSRLQSLYDAVGFCGRDTDAHTPVRHPLKHFVDGWLPKHNLKAGEHLLCVDIAKMEIRCNLPGCMQKFAQTKTSLNGKIC